MGLVWLLVRAETGGVSDGCREPNYLFQRALSPNK